MVKIAINGFGRIGRCAFKIATRAKGVEVVAINDLGDPAALAHLLRHDSVYGTFEKDVKAGDKKIIVGGKEIPVFAEKDPAMLPWKKLGVDIAIESTGVFRSKPDAEKHINAGAKKVVISAPPKGEDVKQFVLGVNESTYNARTDNVVSMASCTTNCLAPLCKVLHNNFGIEHALMATVHAYTGDQNLVDGPHKDLRRARAAACNIIPTTTGAASAIASVMPELKGKIDGMAMRVPVATGSIIDLVATLKKEATAADINAAFKKVASSDLKGILQYSEEELVSSDVIGNPHSSIFDSKLTLVNGNIAKVLSWYDNEFGYATRLIDFAQFLEKKGL